MQQEVLIDAHKKFEQSLRQSGKANATVIAYSKDIEQLIEFMSDKGKTLVAEVTTDDIDEFKGVLKQRRYTSKSISRKINSIKSFFRFLIKEEVVEDNPAESVSHPKIEQSPPRMLTRIEYRALRDAAKGDERLFAIIELLLQTGMRISELAALQTDDIDMDRGVLVIQAQNSRDERKVP